MEVAVIQPNGLVRLVRHASLSHSCIWDAHRCCHVDAIENLIARDAMRMEFSREAQPDILESVGDRVGNTVLPMSALNRCHDDFTNYIRAVTGTRRVRLIGGIYLGSRAGASISTETRTRAPDHTRQHPKANEVPTSWVSVVYDQTGYAYEFTLTPFLLHEHRSVAR